ncbi:MAG: DUF503 domain-containing protein [Anaerolineae bacterium]
MIIGACTLELRLHGVGSLKDKRSIVKPITTRLRQEFNVSVAEIDMHEAWESAVLGLAVVSNDAGHAHAQIEKCIDWIERQRLDADIVTYEIEML